jgi:glycosyltransferase involved in cell wall biosynthesis
VAESPKVSVVIATYIRCKLSSRHCGKRPSPELDYELIVIDDGSTDDTGNILIPYSSQLRYIFGAFVSVECGSTACARAIAMGSDWRPDEAARSSLQNRRRFVRAFSERLILGSLVESFDHTFGHLAYET